MAILEEVRVSFVNIVEPVANLSGDLKYSLQVHISKDDTANVKRAQELVDKAIAKGKATIWGGKVPKFRYQPLRDGDQELADGDQEAPCYKGVIFLNASSSFKFKPGIVDENLQPVTDPDKIYSGCYCHVQLSAYPYKNSGNCGVGWGLQNVMFVSDGDRLDGRMDAKDAFASLAPETNNEDDNNTPF